MADLELDLGVGGAWKPKSKAQLDKWDSVQRNTLTVRAHNVDPVWDAAIPSKAALTVRAPNARRKFAAGPSEAMQREEAARREAATAAAAARRAEEATPPERALDGFMLLDACHVEFPDEARRADLSGCAIGSVSAEDMPYFANLSYLDLGDNHAPFEPLGELPALRELRFHCNLVRSIAGPLLGFVALEVLDLSFNALEQAAIAELAELPCLRELDLTRNELRDVPPDISRCERLEVLVLESNQLHDGATLALLATMPRLKLLNVAHNLFTAVPHTGAAAAELEEGGGEGEGGDGGDGSGTRKPWACLEEVNLACNYIAREDDITALVTMPRLQLAVLYGNPLTEFCEADDLLDAESAGGGRITTVTAEPTLGKRHPARGTYTFQMATVGADAVPTAARFRDAGNANLRASVPLLREPRWRQQQQQQQQQQQAAAVAAQAPALEEEPDTSTVFLTGLGGDAEAGVPPMGPAGGDSGVYRGSAAELVPSAVFDVPLTRPKQGGSDPAALRRAINGLRASLNAPPGRDSLLDRSTNRIDRPTELQRVRQRKRRPFVPKRLGAAARSTALKDLESALDGINARMTLAERDAGSAMNADSNMSELVNSCERVVDALG